jgi:hypothetical protein
VFKRVARRTRPPRRSASSGGAAVEFALVLPIFLAVLFGMIDYGWYYYQRFSLVAAIRDGIRYGVTVAPDTACYPAALQRAKDDLSISGSSINPLNVGWGPLTKTLDGSTPAEFLTLSGTLTFVPLVGFIPYLPKTIFYQMSMLLEVQ